MHRDRTIWLGRWLVAIAAVLGLFALHGLTADHDMPVPQQAAVAHDSLTDQAAESSAATVSLPATSHDHGMGGACLALLATAGLLRFGLLRRGRRLHRLSLAALTGHAAQEAFVRGAAWRPQPSLTTLCIART